MKEYLKIIPSFDILKDSDLDLVCNFFEVKYYNDEDIILKAGKICEHLYFVFKGQVYAHSNDEKEKVFWFEFENSSFTDVESFCNKKPGNYTIKSAEQDTILIRISYDNLHYIFRNYNQWALWGIRFMQNEIVRLTNYYENLRIRDASQRYFELVAIYPGILNRVPLGRIASYLGISQVSLSRIRAGIQKNKKSAF